LLKIVIGFRVGPAKGKVETTFRLHRIFGSKHHLGVCGFQGL